MFLFPIIFGYELYNLSLKNTWITNCKDSVSQFLIKFLKTLRSHSYETVTKWCFFLNRCLPSCCRCAVVSWSVCVTWAGQERTVTPRLLSVTLWWDPRPQFQVKIVDAPIICFPLSTSLHFSFPVHSFFSAFHSCSSLTLSTFVHLSVLSPSCSQMLCWIS